MGSLLNLKTDLKSIKYGHDRANGGSSGQPYIKTDINTVDKGINKLRFGNFDDGLVRGGVIGMLNSSVTDTLRIGKFLTDAPRGPLFIVKQIGLQLSNPRLESKEVKVDRTTKGGGFFTNAINFVANVAGKIENAVGPTRIYNLGINTLAQVPIAGIGGHIVRHGFLPVSDPSKYYESVVTANNKNGTNRLEGLATRFELGGNKGGESKILRKSNKFDNFIKSAAATIATGKFTPAKLVIDSYLAGPGSVYGIGSTLIRRATTPEGADFDTSNNAGKPLVNGERQAFAYIDPETFNGAISSGLGQRNSASGFNKTNRIGGTAYNNPTVDKFGAFFETKTDPNELAKGTDQSVNVAGYQWPDPNIHIASSLNNVNNRFRSGSFFYNFSPSDLIPSDKVYGDRTTLNDRKPDVRDKYNSTAGREFPYNGTPNAIDPLLDPNQGSPSLYPDNTPSSYKDASTIPLKHNLALPNLVYGRDYNTVNTAVENLTAPNNVGNNVGIYATLINGQLNKERLPNSKNIPIYENKYGETVKVHMDWDKVTRELRIGSGRKDQINLTPIFPAEAGTQGDTVNIGGKEHNINDLVKFRIQAIDTDTPSSANWMIFRAYLTGLTDGVDANWSPVKYAGRGDQFYIYDGFTRKMSVSFKVAALSAEEMEPMYQKLNYLMSNLMPDYKDNLMRGPLVRMTIGNYIDGQLCKLDSISYTIPNDSPWEISLASQDGKLLELNLPHIIEVQLSFTPIGSQTRDQNKIARKSECTSNIAQNWNAVSETGIKEYIVPCDEDQEVEPVVDPPVKVPVTDPPVNTGGGGLGGDEIKKTVFQKRDAQLAATDKTYVYHSPLEDQINRNYIPKSKGIVRGGGSLGGGGTSYTYGPPMTEAEKKELYSTLPRTTSADSVLLSKTMFKYRKQ